MAVNQCDRSGGKPRRIHGSRQTVKKEKASVMGLLERNGRVRPRIICGRNRQTLKAVIAENVDKSARIMTNDWSG
jgi:hypothetical protein